MNPKHILKIVSGAIVKKSPEIFIGLAVAGMGASVVLAVKETPKVLKLIEEKKKDLGVDTLTKKETVKVAWKNYIPAAISFVVSTGLMITSNHIQNHRNAMLTAACSASESALLNYINKTKEVVGEEKEKEIRSESRKDISRERSVNDYNVFNANGGDELCMDIETGRYFRSDRESIRAAVNQVNSIMNATGSVSLNTYYDFLGMERTIRGDDKGWWAEGADISRYFVTVDFEWGETAEGQPVRLVDFCNPPKEPTKDERKQYDIYW